MSHGSYLVVSEMAFINLKSSTGQRTKYVHDKGWFHGQVC